MKKIKIFYMENIVGFILLLLERLQDVVNLIINKLYGNKWSTLISVAHMF